jgi:hypothetical protein
MTRTSLASGLRTGAPLAFGALLFLAGVAMAAVAAAAFILTLVLVA